AARPSRREDGRALPGGLGRRRADARRLAVVPKGAFPMKSAAPARVIQAYGTWQKNPLALPASSARAVGERLDALCASEYVLFHQLKKHHWLVVGAEYLPVHEFLDRLADHARLAGDRLAERVTALGGVPTGSPKGQHELAVF